MDNFDNYPNDSQVAVTSGSIFSVEKVQLQFVVNNIVSFVVANNILCMALKTGRIIRIDLEHPQDVDGKFWSLLLSMEILFLTKFRY